MKTILALLFGLALQSCSMPRALPEATDLKSGRSEVVVIGKIELVPPLNAKYEQKTQWNVIGGKRLLTHIWMATGSEYKPVNTAQIDASEFQDSLEVEWGSPFMIKAPRRRTFFNGGIGHLSVPAMERLWFPGGVYFDVPNDAKAVYIGTLRYHRNDFNVITKVEVVEERKDIASVLKAGGSPSEVRTSLLKKVR